MKLVVDAKKLKAVVKAASTDCARYVLNGVNIERSGADGILMVATDGRKLAVIRDVLEIEGDPETFSSFIIPRGLIAKMPKPIAGKITIEYDGQRISLHGDGISVSDMKVGGNYANWKCTMPDTPPTPITCMAVNLEFLSEFQSIGMTLGARGAHIFMHGEGKCYSIKLSGDTQCLDFYGLLMPMRIDAGGEVPSWIGAMR